MTQDELKEILDYNSITGVFTWKISPSRRAKIGDIAGYSDRGYTIIRYNYKNYKAHRLAWLFIYGVIPKMIDHIDRNGSNNSIDNLRISCYSENNKNKSKYSNCKSGVTGVSYSKKDSKWKPTIKVNGKTINLGYYDNFDDAVEIRKNAEREHGFDVTHGK